MIYFNERFLKLEWDATSRILLAEWHGFPTSDQFRAGMGKGLEIIAQHRVTNWLADIREAKAISLADQDYHAKEWTFQAIERGLKRTAYVVPLDVIAHMALNRIVSNTHGLEIKYFSDIDLARGWLASFPAR